MDKEPLTSHSDLGSVSWKSIVLQEKKKSKEEEEVVVVEMFKRKLGDCDAEVAIEQQQFQYHHASSFPASVQANKDHYSYVDISGDAYKRRRCWETAETKSNFMVSPTSAFQLTSTHSICRNPISSIYISQAFALPQHSSWNSSIGQLQEDGSTDHDNTPPSQQSNKRGFFTQQQVNSQLAFPDANGMDVEDNSNIMSSPSAMDDDCPSSQQAITWFDRIRKSTTKSSKTAENVLFTSRHYAFPPERTNNNAGFYSTQSQHNQTQAQHSQHQQPAKSCMYCLRHCLPIASTSTTASGGYLSCNYCDRMCCAETCLRACENCHGIFCGVCSTTDYSRAYERYLCLDCSC